MADGEKWILERWADAFDQMRLEKMHRLDQSNHQRIQELHQLHGYGDWFTPGQRAVHEAALGMGVKYAFLEVSAELLGSYVDVLRLGEVVRKPSIGAVVRDGLRLLTIVPFAGSAAKAVGKSSRFKNFIEFVRLEYAARVPGTPNSCGPTGLTRALTLSGTKMFARISDVVKGVEVAGRRLTKADVLSKDFAGIENIKSFIPSLERLGMRFNSVLPKPVKEDLFGLLDHFREYEKIVKTTGKPIIVTVSQSKSATNIEPHVLLMYRDAKGIVKYADPGGFARTAEEVIYFYDNIDEAYQVSKAVIHEAYQISNTAVLHPAAIPSVAGLGRAVARDTRSPFWLDLLGVPMYVVDQTFMDSVEAGVTKRIGEINGVAAQPVAPTNSTPAGQTPKIKNFTILTPNVRKIPGNSESPAINLTGYLYFVKKGDTLFGLAKNIYGDAAKYKFIQAANADLLMRLKGDQQLPIGTSLIIPGN